MGVKTLKLLRAAAIILSFSFMAQGEAKAGTFSFTKIADSQDVYKDFQAPSINNQGIIAFSSNLDTNIEAVYTSDGINTKTIFEGRPFPLPPLSPIQKDVFSIPSINDNNQVVVTRIFDSFIPSRDEYSVLLGDGINQSQIAFVPGLEGVQGSGSIGDPFINNNGEVVVRIFFSPRFSPTTNRISVLNNQQGGSIDLTNFSLPIDNPLINDRGEIAQLFTRKLSLFDGTTTELSAKNFQGLSLNNLGKVSFVAEELDGFSGSPNSGIFTFDGTNISKVVDADGIFNSFKNTSINDGGAVAFLANLDNGNLGIFSGEDKVIGVGDRLFGSTISSLKFNREGLNNSGQLAFYAEFTDGKKGIFRADIVQHSTPESSTVVGVLFIGLIGWQKVKSSC